MSGNLVGIVAQRLVRLLCPACKIPHACTDAEKAVLGIALSEPFTLYRPVGCPACKGRGYKGRTNIMELLRFDAQLDEMVSRSARSPEILAYARSKGFTTMAEDGLARVLAGTTSLEEVARMVDLTERDG
jgi:general secretion pathway protein E/type IV pilus assembly protein PilB